MSVIIQAVAFFIIGFLLLAALILIACVFIGDKAHGTNDDPSYPLGDGRWPPV